MAGLKPKFSIAAVNQFLQQKTENYEKQVIKTLQYQGEQFVTRARLKTKTEGSFGDITGNLRSSIGYVILKDGEPLDENFGNTAKGQHEGKRIAREVGRRFPQGLVLIGVAGMEYAAAVEAKGYDVISGSAPTSQEIKKMLNAIKL